MGRNLKQLLEAEKPEIVTEAETQAERILLDIKIREIRELMGKTQVEMAAALGIKQPTLAGIEKTGHDPKLSTLKRYVEAGGGKIRLNIELPDGNHYEFPL